MRIYTKVRKHLILILERSVRVCVRLCFCASLCVCLSVRASVILLLCRLASVLLHKCKIRRFSYRAEANVCPCLLLLIC